MSSLKNMQVLAYVTTQRVSKTVIFASRITRDESTDSTMANVNVQCTVTVDASSCDPNHPHARLAGMRMVDAE
jgi:hypothetical protein